uniref:Large ribosomal subunit protein mL62 n=1 Tax=Arion vulgaris TaxID=1028688 RepID=A0A0B6ZMY7_9EUPU
MFRLRPSFIALGRQSFLAIGDTCSPKIQTASFKSHISIDKIYPNSNTDYLRPINGMELLKPQVSTNSKGQEQFTGYIPVDQLKITVSRSSGPGGQSVNTTNSKVEIRFHVESASWIPDWIKPRVTEQAEGKITKDGFLVIRSDMTRKQILNQADCMNKLRNLIFAASVLPKEPTKEEIKLKNQRIESKG